MESIRNTMRRVKSANSSLSPDIRACQLLEGLPFSSCKNSAEIYA